MQNPPGRQKNQRKKEMTKKSNLAEIGSRIKGIRKSLQLKQVEFSNELNISNSTLSEIERGNIKPGIDLVINLAIKFNVNLYYVLLGDGDMFIGTRAFLGSTRKFAVNTEDVERFLWYFERSKIIQLLTLGNFQALLLKENESIEKEVEAFNSKTRE
jgi:transcriptional regulator with XRE-family HTH domain